jgi:2',3'-cyclic-nucleotide 2'-phosphodiesterase (5'-nucleotidase family)
VVGRTARRLVRRYNEESAIGDLFADILREHGRSEVAFIHSGAIRADLPAGEVTRENLLDAFPFVDRVVTLRMTGADILDVLEQSVTLERGVLQVSGLTVTYDLGRAVGARVESVRVGGERLEPTASYSVTTLDFLAAGADLFEGFRGAQVVEPRGPAFADLLEAHFATNELVIPPAGGRLVPAR